MRTDSASSLKETNQGLKAQINVFLGEIENLKMQLTSNADGESTAATATAVEQTVKDQKRSPTNKHSDFQSVQTRY